MKPYLGLPVFLAAGAALWSHPMGNFSVSHYSRLTATANGLEIRYVLDLAEIPTFQLLQQWKLDASSPHSELQRRAAAQARVWSRNLSVRNGARNFEPSFERATLAMQEGALGMPVMRVTADLRVAGASGEVRYEDANYRDRAGWKEIVIVAGAGAVVEYASPAGKDRSRELTAFPEDPLMAPPQDLTAAIRWRLARPLLTSTPVTPAPAMPPRDAIATTGQSAPGTVVRGDFLSTLLQKGDISFGMILVGMAVAFGLGAVHALSPGHGKTIVAAYLVGSRGTAKHALFLGGMVTFTHTVSVFFLGFVTLFLSQYVLPEKIYPVLGAISGISIVWIGTSLFFRRLRAAKHGRHHHHPHHHHNGELVHDHGDGHVHSHMPQGDVSTASLIALGASGGLVPCPSALVLLLSSVALGRVGLGLTLLVAFSAGLAVVLSAIGLVALFAKHLLPDSEKTAASRAFRYLPVASAAVITCAGLIMTGVALGV